MIVGCYTLNLYCDHEKHITTTFRVMQGVDAEYIGHTYLACKRQATRDGWRIRKDKALCPECVKKGYKIKIS